MRAAVILSAIWMCLFSAPASASAEYSAKVLVLHAYHPGFKWTDFIQQGVLNELGNDEEVDLYVEYMDSKRTFSQSLFPALASLYKQKFGNRYFDVILTSDDNALNFVLQYRNQLFASTPVVFCGVNNFSMERLKGQQNITGVVEDVDFQGTTELILKLFPGTENIAVISDVTLTGALHQKVFESEVESKLSDPKLSDQVHFIRLYGLTAEALSERLRNLPDHSAVFNLTFWRDPSGQSFNHRESNSLIVNNSARPVFTAWDHTLVYGVLGGLTTNGRMQGTVAAKMVKRILNGEKASDIPIVEKSPNMPMFDYKVMQRFGIKKKDLPEDSIVLNEPESFYYKHKHLIWVIAIFLILQTLAIVLLVASIISRKKAQRELSESEKRLRSFLEFSPLPIAVDDKDGNIVFLNDKFTEIFGYSKNDIQKLEDWWPLAYPDAEIRNETRRTWIKAVRDASQKGSDITPIERTVTCKDGKQRYIRFTYRSLGDLGISILNDLTEHKRNEEALQYSEARLKALSEASFEAIFLSENGICLDQNKTAERMFGYTREEAIGRHGTEWIIPEDRELVKENMLSGYAKPYEVTALRKDGETFPCEIQARQLEYQDRLVRLTALRDISERKKAEEALRTSEERFRQAQKMESIGRLAGGVSHDLNNLLSPIIGYSEMLLNDFNTGDSRRESISEILRAGLKARDLVHQLLAFSRKQALEYKPANLNTVLSEFEKLIRRTIREDIEVEIIPSAAAPMILGDIGQIEQVIMNLSVNAQDAMPQGGKLTFQTDIAELDAAYTEAHPPTLPGKYAVLMVSDTGCGMNEETLEHLFEPFYSTKGEKGTGLGLSTVYGIVKQHGGNIWVYSEAGMGTTIKIYLPASSDEQVQKQAVEKKAADYKGAETILIVEDNEQVRHLAHHILQRHGYQIFLAGNGNEAMAQLEASDQPIDLLLTDVVMPEMNGRELFARIAEKHPNLKVLFMSGYTDNVIVHHGVLDHDVHFIQKPFSVENLSSKVREILDGA